MLDVLITPMTLMLILAAGYLLKHLGVFGATDYRVVQAIEFDLVLPGAIVHSFATNDHSLGLLWISLFSLAATLVPPTADLSDDDTYSGVRPRVHDAQLHRFQRRLLLLPHGTGVGWSARPGGHRYVRHRQQHHGRCGD